MPFCAFRAAERNGHNDGHSRKKASPFESEIHPSHKSDDLYKRYFAPAEGLRLCPGVRGQRRSRKPPGVFRCCPTAAAA